MRDSAWYNKLWQTKMQELPLKGDEYAAWQKMQGLLDSHMPVSSPVVTPKPGASLWIKVMYALIAATIVAVVYYAIVHIPVTQHKKLIKPIGKHALRNADSSVDKIQLIPTALQTKQPGDSVANLANNDSNKNEAERNGDKSSVIPAKALYGHSADVKVTKGNVVNNPNLLNNPNNKNKPGNPAVLFINSAGINNSHNSNRYSHRKGTASYAASVRRKNVLSKSGTRLYNLNLLKTKADFVSDARKHSKKVGEDISLSKDNRRLLANENLQKENQTTSVNTGNSGSGIVAGGGATQKNDVANLSAKESTQTTKDAETKQVADAKVKSQNDKSSLKNKKGSTPKSSDSNFSLDVQLGVSTNKGSNLNPFLGIADNYSLNNKWSVSVGTNLPSTRIISGYYRKDNFSYTTIGDSSKKINHNSGQLTVSGTKKIYYVDVPVFARYKLSEKFSIIGGALISIPIKAGATKTTFGPLSGSADTTTLRTVTPYVNSTRINSKVNFSLSAGARYNIKRFYVDAVYLQAINPYSISSDLGSGKIYYRTIQIGIGYQLFKTKN